MGLGSGLPCTSPVAVVVVYGCIVGRDDRGVGGVFDDAHDVGNLTRVCHLY